MEKLEYKDKFLQAIADYRPSADVLDLANGCQLLIVSGVTSAGRQTVINRLAEDTSFHKIVSDTTRKPRENEEGGVEYFFKSEEEMLNGIEAGKYLGLAIIHEQQVSGISLEELELISGEDTIGISDMEIKGATKVLSQVPYSKAIFVIPPNFEEWTERVTKRGLLDQEEVKKRLKEAEAELEEALTGKKFEIVVNDLENYTTQEVIAIVREQERKPEDKDAAEENAWLLLNQLKQFLTS